MKGIASIRQVLARAAFALWWGGFTFYAIVVIPTAQKVLHSHVKVGFITQEVTHWINLAAVLALALLLWELLSATPLTLRRRRWLWAAWLVMAAMQAALFLLHPALDRLLDFSAREITDEPLFYFLHRVYLILSTVQWLAAWLVWAVNSRMEPDPPDA